MSRKPNRWNAARDAHDAAMRCPPHRARITHPAYSLPASRVLGWMAWAVVAAAAYHYLPHAAAFIRGFM